MTHRVLLFASYADALGGPSVDLALPEGATVASLVERLRALPGSERLPTRPVVAVNQVYARYDQRVAPGDEIAVIPPVAGG